MDQNFDWSGYATCMAELQGLELDKERHAEVVTQLQRIYAVACELLDFPLPGEVEPAPIFRP